VPTLLVAAHAALALVCAYVARTRDAHDARLWRLAALALAALAVDRHFGLLDAVTAAARNAFVAAGWYDDRRLLQRWGVLAVGLAGAAVFAFVLRRLRPWSLAAAAALAGVLFLVCLDLARASSQHRVDAFLMARAAFGLRWQAVLEWLGLAAVAAGAATAVAARR
jgi:hypothetical protein